MCHMFTYEWLHKCISTCLLQREIDNIQRVQEKKIDCSKLAGKGHQKFIISESLFSGSVGKAILRDLLISAPSIIHFTQQIF